MIFNFLDLGIDFNFIPIQFERETETETKIKIVAQEVIRETLYNIIIFKIYLTLRFNLCKTI